MYIIKFLFSVDAWNVRVWTVQAWNTDSDNLERDLDVTGVMWVEVDGREGMRGRNMVIGWCGQGWRRAREGRPQPGVGTEGVLC